MKYGKIIKINDGKAVIACKDDDIIRVNGEDIDFPFTVGQLVEVYNDNGEYIITETDKQTTTSKVENFMKTGNFRGEEERMNVTNNYYGPRGRRVNKVIYILIALFLGTLGFHKFYAGKTFAGIMYLLFSWTFIPTVLSVFDIIGAAFKPADSDGNIYF